MPEPIRAENSIFHYLSSGHIQEKLYMPDPAHGHGASVVLVTGGGYWFLLVQCGWCGFKSLLWPFFHPDLIDVPL